MFPGYFTKTNFNVFLVKVFCGDISRDEFETGVLGKVQNKIPNVIYCKNNGPLSVERFSLITDTFSVSVKV